MLDPLLRGGETGEAKETDSLPLSIDGRIAEFVAHWDKDLMVQTLGHDFAPISRPHPCGYLIALKKAMPLLHEKLMMLSALSAADKIVELSKIKDFLGKIHVIIRGRSSEIAEDSREQAQLIRQKEWVERLLSLVFSDRPSDAEYNIARYLAYCDSLKKCGGVILSLYCCLQLGAIGLLNLQCLPGAPQAQVGYSIANLFISAVVGGFPYAMRSSCGGLGLAQGYDPGSGLCSTHGACFNSQDLLDKKKHSEVALCMAVTNLAQSSQAYSPPQQEMK